MIVGKAAILFQLYAQGNASVPTAIKQLTEKPLGIVIVLLFAPLPATSVTQAFEFEVIRLLEGYFNWSFPPAQALMAMCIRRHARKRVRVEAKLLQAEGCLHARESGHAGAAATPTTELLSTSSKTRSSIENIRRIWTRRFGRLR
jgi:hypothetical protein